jgi:uncharacterized protein YfiM (DUF2279 family)
MHISKHPKHHLARRYADPQKKAGAGFTVAADKVRSPARTANGRLTHELELGIQARNKGGGTGPPEHGKP